MKHPYKDGPSFLPLQGHLLSELDFPSWGAPVIRAEQGNRTGFRTSRATVSLVGELHPNIGIPRSLEAQNLGCRDCGLDVLDPESVCGVCFLGQSDQGFKSS